MAEGRTDVDIRPFDAADVPAAAELFRRTWLGDLPPKEGSLAATLVLGAYLSDHAWGLVACDRKEMLGIILGGLRDTDQSARWARLGEEALAQARELDPSLPGRIQADSLIEAEEARMTQELKASDLPQADATIQLLLLAPGARGHHLGSRLLDAARSWFASQGARGYFLMTDDECDVGFYDHLGLQRMRTRSVETPRGTVGVYAYGELL